MSSPLLYFRHPSSLEHDPRLLSPDHPDTPERIVAIETAMARVGWLGCEVRDAPAAPEREIELVHTATHVNRIRDLCAAGGGQIDPDTFVGEASYQAALHAVGGACELVRALLRGEARAGFSATRPSGHHAGRDYAMGFCLFNNVAIAAELAIRELGAERVLIIDWDVHHGNGTADIFRRRSDVLFASIHELGLFPGTGEVSDAGAAEGRGYTINVPVPHGSDEETWVSALEYVIIPAALEFGPQLVLISAGFDAHRDDPLAHCLLEPSSFAQMACHVRDMAGMLGVPVGAVLEGGYHPPAVTESLMATVAALSGVGTAESIAPDPFVTSRAAAHIGHYWTL
ncbi:MAG TPA: histone deacetylase [Solirubrobacteraceae bacterium]|nr:histone deacetylase [Solirubrobacteraceae bacterium]